MIWSFFLYTQRTIASLKQAIKLTLLLIKRLHNPVRAGYPASQTFHGRKKSCFHSSHGSCRNARVIFCAVKSTDQHDACDRNNADSHALSSFAKNVVDVKVRVVKSKFVKVGPPESDLLVSDFCASFGNTIFDGQGCFLSLLSARFDGLGAI